MKRNSPHTNKENKPSPTKKTRLGLIASRRQHARARFTFGILNSAPSWTKCLKCRCGSSRSPLEGLANSWFKKSAEYKNACACMSVFLHKHAQCYSTFVSGTDFSLAFGLLLCHTDNNLPVCANILCYFIGPFVLWMLSVCMRCIAVNYV